MDYLLRIRRQRILLILRIEKWGFVFAKLPDLIHGALSLVRKDNMQVPCCRFYTCKRGQFERTKLGLTSPHLP